MGEITHVQHSVQPTLVPRNGFDTAPGALPRWRMRTYEIKKTRGDKAEFDFGEAREARLTDRPRLEIDSGSFPFHGYYVQLRWRAHVSR